MMRRHAKVIVACPAELKAALDPRQRFVDEITAVRRSLAEVWRRQPLLPSATRVAPLTGGLTAGARALGKSCWPLAAIGRISRPFGAVDRVFTSKHASHNDTSRASGRVLDPFQLGCISTMRGTHPSDHGTARLDAAPAPIAKWCPRMPNPGKNPKRASGVIHTLTDVCLGPRCCQAVLAQ